MDVVLPVDADWMQMIVKGKEEKRKRKLTGCSSWWWSVDVDGSGLWWWAVACASLNWET